MTTPALTRGRTFGPRQTTLHVDETPVGRPGSSPRPGSRFLPRRIPFVSQLLRRWGKGRDERSQSRPPPSEQPPIPSALSRAVEVDSTPLPTLPMVVLSIVCSHYFARTRQLNHPQTLLGEFLSANVSSPFILFMVEGEPYSTPGDTT
jgi:hypothetical protein